MSVKTAEEERVEDCVELIRFEIYNDHYGGDCDGAAEALDALIARMERDAKTVLLQDAVIAAQKRLLDEALEKESRQQIEISAAHDLLRISQGCQEHAEQEGDDLKAEVEGLHEALSVLLVHNEDDDIYSVIGLGSASFGDEQQLSEHQDQLVRDALSLQRATNEKVPGLPKNHSCDCECFDCDDAAAAYRKAREACDDV